MNLGDETKPKYFYILKRYKKKPKHHLHWVSNLAIRQQPATIWILIIVIFSKKKKNRKFLNIYSLSLSQKRIIIIIDRSNRIDRSIDSFYLQIIYILYDRKSEWKLSERESWHHRLNSFDDDDHHHRFCESTKMLCWHYSQRQRLWWWWQDDWQAKLEFILFSLDTKFIFFFSSQVF